MKKILGISLCALFAVSAANAEIASKAYVDQQVGAIDTSGIETNAAAIATNADNISANTDSINALTGRVDGHNTTIQANTAAITDINEDIAGMNFGPTTKHYVKIVSQENGTVSATDADFANTVDATIQNNAPTSAAVAAHVKSAITALNATQTTKAYVKNVRQENGKVIATDADFAADVTTGGTNAPTSAAVVTYVDGKVSGLEVDALEGRVDANESAIGTNTTNIQTNAGNIATNTADISTNRTNIATNATAISGINTTIEGLELPETTGNYVRVVSQAGGQVSATARDFENELNSGTTDNAPTSKAVANYVADNAIQGVTTGGTNGTILVDNQEVAVKGLEAMAYKAAVTSAEIADRTIVNVDIKDDAEIASTKIAFTDAQKTVFGSGIDSAKVAQIGTNETDIDNIQNFIARMVDNAPGYTDCKDSTYGCTLVVDREGFKWETVKRTN